MRKERGLSLSTDCREFSKAFDHDPLDCDQEWRSKRTLTTNDWGGEGAREDLLGGGRRLSGKALCKGTLALGIGFVRRVSALIVGSSPSRLRFLDRSLSASMLTGAVGISVIDLEGWTALFDIDMVFSWQRATTRFTASSKTFNLRLCRACSRRRRVPHKLFVHRPLSLSS
jgi:hypothetical protein